MPDVGLEQAALEAPVSPSEVGIPEATDSTSRAALGPAGVEILTVEKATGQPVPGADVWFAPRSMLEERWTSRANMRNGDREELLRQHGEHAEAREEHLGHDQREPQAQQEDGKCHA